MTRIADPYSPEIMAAFRQEHYTTVSGNVSWHWSCTCGAGSKSAARTQGIASHGQERHLRAEHRKFIARLEGSRRSPA